MKYRVSPSRPIEGLPPHRSYAVLVVKYFALVFSFFAFWAVGSDFVQNYEFSDRESRVEQMFKAARHVTGKKTAPVIDDPWGGGSPKETLNLFAKALEMRDVDIAQKYIIGSKRQEWRDKYSDKSVSAEYVSSLRTLSAVIQDEEWQTFSQYTVRKPSYAVFSKNSQGLWKIAQWP